MSAAKPFITLVSRGGHRFVLPREAAMGSQFIANNLSSDFAEGTTGVITLSERAEIVDMVVQYLMYKQQYKDAKGDIPDFQDRVKPELALELLMAADFMEC